MLLGRKVMTNLDSIFKSRDKRSVNSRLWFFLWSCMDVRVGLKKAEHRRMKKRMKNEEKNKRMKLLNCGVGEDS